MVDLKSVLARQRTKVLRNEMETRVRTGVHAVEVGA